MPARQFLPASCRPGCAGNRIPGADRPDPPESVDSGSDRVPRLGTPLAVPVV